MIGVTFSENDCLAYDPFDGDFGMPGDRILKDKIVLARKSGQCHICGQQIKPGEKIRSMAAVYTDDGFMSFRWCSECCAAMAAYWGDDVEAIDRRYALRHDVAKDRAI